MASDALELTITIAASRETVFRYLTDPARFGAWVGGQVALDPREGGDLRVVFPGGSIAEGRVVELVPGERFVCTWGYVPAVHGMAAGSTRLELSLRSVPEGTRVTLRHTALPSAEAAQAHMPGWRAMLAQLSLKASGEDLSARLPGVLADYFAAWNERDDGERDRLLKQCVSPDVEFADNYARVGSREGLSGHIANALRHMPGLTLRGAPPVQTCHAWVRFGWEVAGPDGAIAFKGQNFGRLAADGTLASIVGFWDQA